MLDPPERLRKAIVAGNLAISKRLLARFPELWLNVDPAHQGWCNLHYASFHGHYLVCFHLVSQMSRVRLNESSLCDLDLVTFDGLTVLHMPLRHHHSQTLHFLLQEFLGARWLDRRGGPVHRTPLHYCCVFRFIDGVKLLLEYGADWRLPDANGDTCLHLCFAYGGLKCIEALLNYVM
ncbi:ankyrin, partial [Metschnikowia bicuspidata var. bicuspidata NRRL YB-4993]